MTPYLDAFHAVECESSDSDEEEHEDDNVSYFSASFRTNNHIMCSDVD